MEWLFEPEALIALATLTGLEIVLGIDNIVFIAIMVGKLPEPQRPRARIIGLAGAMITRLLLLFSLTWMMSLTAPLFEVLNNEISGRDLILLIGGLFLLAKSTMEIHEKMEGEESGSTVRAQATFMGVIFQIALLDIVFSLDSVITAIGMAKQVWVMATAIVIAVIVMMIAAGPISRFIDQHPTVKMLALSFLLLIGVMLVGEGLDMHIPKGYIYFAMAFSIFVEFLNTKIHQRKALGVRREV